MKNKWLSSWLSGKPHFVVGTSENPYLYRWYIIPRNQYFNLYLHKFLRDDEDRALHDHPWWFISVLFSGRYIEITDGNKIIDRQFGDIAFRPAVHRHRVVLPLGLPCWTIVLTGCRTRDWGFWCPKGFVPWQEFTKADNPGEIGRGCE